MPEETWSLNEERISDEAFLEMVATTLGENEAMLFDTLGQEDRELVVAVFVQPDRVSHMFCGAVSTRSIRYMARPTKWRVRRSGGLRRSDRILGGVSTS